MCVVGRRIPVWILWEMHKAGWTNKQLLKNLPTLDRQRLAAALRYAKRNNAKIQAEWRKHNGQDEETKPRRHSALEATEK
jgi:uncharacterized protein (DUF433 family)